MPALDSVNHHFSLDAREFKLFRTLIHGRTGIWLADGKQIMLASRLSKRLRHLGLDSFTEYYQLVQAGGDGGIEIGELINCVTTNKTSFFREPHHFEFLMETVVPEILAAPAGKRATTISVWSAACSTGEEPYSIALTLLEALRMARAASIAGWQAQVTASDIDTKVLEKAESGVYAGDALDSVPAELKKKIFPPRQGQHGWFHQGEAGSGQPDPFPTH